MAMASLFESGDCACWKRAADVYQQVLELVAGQKKKGKDTLLELDKWYQQSLPTAIGSRKRPHITHAELAKLMKWKLTRGKFRPRLEALVQQNPQQLVESVSAQAIEALPDLAEAVKTLGVLKGVGPATASAVLCAAAPHQVPFMADECVSSVPGSSGQIQYTLQGYLSYAREIQKKAKLLNNTHTDCGVQAGTWTPHRVELALWSHHFAKKLGPKLLELEDRTSVSASASCLRVIGCDRDGGTCDDAAGSEQSEHSATRTNKNAMEGRRRRRKSSSPLPSPLAKKRRKH